MTTLENQGAYQKAWYLKFNDPSSQRALWLRFTLLSSKNGFKKIAETWAIFFQKLPHREIRKMALKQTYDIGEFSLSGASGVRIGECELTETFTRGVIQSKGNSIKWDLTLTSGRESSFRIVPESLTKFGLIKNSIVTDCEELLMSGTTQINDETLSWKEAPGMKGHLFGPKSGHSWIWGHCNLFTNEEGKLAQFIFEGLSARTQIGPLVTPLLSSFFFFYQGQNYFFNTLKDLLFLKSSNTLNEWRFQADRGDISFRGYAKAEHKDFAGLTFEDTNGSLLYCANSKLSDMKILVYRSGKLEATFTALGTASFEVVSRTKNPYVPLLI